MEGAPNKRTIWKKVLGFGSACLGFFLATAVPAAAQINTDIGGLELTGRSPVETVLYIISWVLGILALIAVIIVLWGGFTWLTSQGNEEKIDRAKKILINGGIGLLIILAAWGIVLYALSVLGAATGTGTEGNGGNGGGPGWYPSGGSNFYVLRTEPDANDSPIPICTAVSVFMNLQVDVSTVTDDTFFIMVQGGAFDGAQCGANNSCASGVCDSGTCVGDHVAGQIAFGPEYEGAPRSFDFIPEQDFLENTGYDVRVRGGSSGVLSFDANGIDPVDDRLSMSSGYIFTLTTGTEDDNIPPKVDENSFSPFPADGEVDICTNTVINFDFTEAMLPSSFNDERAIDLAYAGTDQAPVDPDWINSLGFRGWDFCGDSECVMVRPDTQLDDYSRYSTRLFGGDPNDDFAGAPTDMCGNPLSGDGDDDMEGRPMDNYIGYDPGQGETETPITWTTGENADCTPVVDSITPLSDFYGEYAGLREGEACTGNAECGSGSCVDSECVGYGPTTLLVSGLYLGPHPMVRMNGSDIWAGDGYRTCFNEQHLGNVRGNTSVGDYCIDDALQSLSEIVMRTPVGAGDSTVEVEVAGERSAPSADEVDVLSPYIWSLSPTDGSVGQYITIVGENYGTTEGTVTMYSSDGTRESVLQLPTGCGEVWTEDEIVAIVPETYTDLVTGQQGSWLTDDVAYVQVYNAQNGRYSDLEEFTFSDVVRPNLCALEPNCSAAAGASFTATGENFGAAQANSNVIFTDSFANSYNAAVSAWGDTQIQGTTDGGMGQNWYWTVVYNEDTGLSSNGRSYEIPCSEGPQVVNIGTCDQANDIYPVPQPRPNDTSACINAHVAILFDQEMDQSTLNPQNMHLKQYNPGQTLDENYTPLDLSYHAIDTNWTVAYGNETYHGVKVDIDSTPEVDQDGDPTGGSSIYLQPDTWYRGTVTTGVKNIDGVNMATEYTYDFKTDSSGDLCEIDTISVQPTSATKNSYWTGNDRTSQAYAGSAYDVDCNMLDGGGYSWQWEISNVLVGDFGPQGNGEIPNGTESETVYVAGNDEENEGTAAVNVAVTQASDDAQFTVDLAFCQSDEDCQNCPGSTCNLDTNHCTPQIQNFTPTNGDHGTWVTVNGCMFGSAKGNAYWNSQNDSIHAETEWPDANNCGDTWKNTQIVLEVPDQYDSDDDGTVDADLPEEDYNIEIETQFGDTAETAAVFALNEEERPGICRIEPSTAREHQTVQVTGQLLGADKGEASFLTDGDADGNGVQDRISADAADTNWEPSAIAARVPAWAVTGLAANNQDGFRAIVSGAPDDQCNDASYCSNGLDFEVVCYNDWDCASGCCSPSGLCVEADQCLECFDDAECVDGGACPGSQCVNGICTPVINSLAPSSGPEQGPTTIQGCYFASRAQDSSVTFDDVAAQILCTNGWSNTQIIAEVPAGTPQAPPADVVVTTKYGDTSNTKNFSVTADCNGFPLPANGVPILCDLSPGSGRAASSDGLTPGEEIRFTGYDSRFQQTGMEDLFYNLIAGDAFFFFSANTTFAEVPSGAGSGNAYAKVDQCIGNGIEFAIECTNAAECQTGQYCINNICTDDPCGGGSGECTVAEEEAQCGTGGGCYFDNTYQQNCCAEKPQVDEVSVQDGESGVCPNARFTVRFSEVMNWTYYGVRFEKLNPNTQAWQPVAPNKQWNNNTNGTPNDPSDDYTVVKIRPTQLLELDTTYRIQVRSTPNQGGGQMTSATTGLYLLNGTQTWEFTTSANTCTPTSVELINDETGGGDYTFSEPDGSTSFSAVVRASNGDELEPGDVYDWTYVWSPYYDEQACNNVAWINADESESADAESQPVVSGQENAQQATLEVEVNATQGWSGTLNDTATLQTFFCDPADIWEYTDENGGANYVAHNNPQHFRLLYCMDGDTPQLVDGNGDPNVIVDDTPGPNDDWFLQFFFISADNEDYAFAMRAYGNDENLSPELWYEQNVPTPGSPASTTVNGYEAVRDGLSYYIAASNVHGGSIYNNIYLLTFNDEEGMDLVTDQILEYFLFNNNVSYADCEGSDKQKLVRDTKRLNDLFTVAYFANRYYASNQEYPEPQSQNFGSYISELTTSVWNSWQGALGNLFGTTLPVDPYNFFFAYDSDAPWEAGNTPWVSDDNNIQDCENKPEQNIYWDEAGTCWDPVNNEFYCPEHSHVYMWKRNSADDAYLYARFEYESTTGQDYIELYPLSVSPCSGISNAVCGSCFNVGITSEDSPGNLWQALP